MKILISIAAIILSSQTAFTADSYAVPGQSKVAEQVVNINSTAEGFEPNKIYVSSQTPVILKVTRTSDQTCGTEIVIKEKKINQKLPLNETVIINLGLLKKGEIKFACAMNMIKGTLNVK